MKSMTSLVAGLCIAVTADAIAAEKKVQLKDVPAPVQAAVREHTRDSTIKAVIEEADKGKLSYEVETTRAGKARDLVFDAAGALVEVEEEMAMEAAPAAVRSALGAHGKVIKLESLTKGGVVTYEAQVEKGGKRSEVLVDTDGKPVKH